MAQEKGKPHLLVLFLFIFLTADKFSFQWNVLLQESLRFFRITQKPKKMVLKCVWGPILLSVPPVQWIKSTVFIRGAPVWLTAWFGHQSVNNNPDMLWHWTTRSICELPRATEILAEDALPLLAALCTIVSNSTSPPFHLSHWNATVICYFHDNFSLKSSIKPSVNLLPLCFCLLIDSIFNLRRRIKSLWSVDVKCILELSQYECVRAACLPIRSSCDSLTVQLTESLS